VIINSLTERMDITFYTVPIQFSYRFKIKKIENWVFNIKAGPALTYIVGLTDYNAMVDVGGIYQVDTVNKNRVTYYNYFDAGSTWNIYLNASGIDRQNSNPGAAAVFAQLDSAGNYDFVSEKNYHGRQKLSRITFACNFSLDGQYRKSKNSPIAIKAGIHFMYTPSIGAKEKYKPIEKTAGPFNSIFNSNGKSSYFAYGVNIGLVYDF
jgi:hypothetical protein